MENGIGMFSLNVETKVWGSTDTESKLGRHYPASNWVLFSGLGVSLGVHGGYEGEIQ